MFGVKLTITSYCFTLLSKMQNVSFVPCFAFVLCILTSAVPFYMDHKPGGGRTYNRERMRECPVTIYNFTIHQIFRSLAIDLNTSRDRNLAASRLCKYLPLFTSTSVNNC